MQGATRELGRSQRPRSNAAMRRLQASKSTGGEQCKARRGSWVVPSDRGATQQCDASRRFQARPRRWCSQSAQPRHPSLQRGQRPRHLTRAEPRGHLPADPRSDDATDHRGAHGQTADAAGRGKDARQPGKAGREHRGHGQPRERERCRLHARDLRRQQRQHGQRQTQHHHPAHLQAQAHRNGQEPAHGQTAPERARPARRCALGVPARQEVRGFPRAHAGLR